MKRRLLYQAAVRWLICRLGSLHDWRLIEIPVSVNGDKPLMVRQCPRCGDMEVYLNEWVPSTGIEMDDVCGTDL